MQTIAYGFAFGLSLILAIGAQNAFVLRQGLRRAHVFAVCLTCALSDALLIVAGVAGFGWMAQAAPWIAPVFAWGGAAFLIAYGALAFHAAWRGAARLDPTAEPTQPFWPTILTCLALTWLNPHVYLDTVILLGSIAASVDSPALFGVGAVAASFAFFFGLGYGARGLAPLFARPVAWRVLDVLIGVVMWSIAGGLIRGALA